MKRLLRISAIALIYLLLCSKSCVDDTAKLQREKLEIGEEKDKLHDEFGADYLTEDSRHAMEIKAKQILEDLGDYLSIFSDISMDSLFRRKAGELIENTFVSNDAELSFGRIRGTKIKQQDLKEFLKDGFGKNIQSVLVKFDSITISDPLRKTGGATYTGQLSCIQHITSISGKDTLDLPPAKIIVDIISVKKEKAFGTDTLKTWGVYLGNMR